MSNLSQTCSDMSAVQILRKSRHRASAAAQQEGGSAYDLFQFSAISDKVARVSNTPSLPAAFFPSFPFTLAAYRELFRGLWEAS